MKKDKIPGGLSKGKSLKDIAAMHSKKRINNINYDVNSLFDKLKNELKKGIKIEFEHTEDRNIAREIAMDHLYEDPKYYTKLSKIEENKILNEEQKFDFDGKREEIIKFIKKIKAGKKTTQWDNPFYKLIVGDTMGALGASQKIGISKENADKWKQYFSSGSFYTDGVWSQRDFNENIKRKSGERSYNFYISIDKTKENIAKFWSSLRLLDQKLKKLSDEKQTPISYKTHRLLDAFIAHNDSLKIYYYDIDLKQDIENLVKDWISENNIIRGSRTHSHGVDKKDDTGQKRSFGELLALHIGRELEDNIKRNPNYTDEQWFMWIKKYLPDMIKKVKVDPINESKNYNKMKKTKKLNIDELSKLIKTTLNEESSQMMPHQDHEAKMAKAELRDMVKNAKEIYNMIKEGDQLPGWISAYITLASDYMHSVNEYMVEHNSQGEELEEAIVPAEEEPTMPTLDKSKLNLKQFSEWLGFQPEEVKLALDIAKMSGPEDAIDDLENMGRTREVKILKKIFYDYGSLSNAKESCKKDLGF